MSTPMKLLVACDGSPYADDAIDDLRRAGLPDKLQALVVSVSEIPMPEPPSQEEADEPEGDTMVISPWRIRAEQALVMARVHARQAADKIRGYFPRWTITTKVFADSPAWGLLSAADEMHSDLVVIGSRGRSAIVRLLLGSVSQKVLTEARCSVRVARRSNFVEGSPVRIVLGLDGSPDAYRALEALLIRPWSSGTSVRVVAAYDGSGAALSLVPEAIEYDFDLYERQRDALEQEVKQAVDRLRGAGLTAAGEVREGSPTRVLLHLAEEWGADVIFLGARGDRSNDRFLLGSVSSAVAARAHCSVEVVRSS
jgi:nucleotide-binding universal stress UspA family protein